jgi:hypothetical protein
MKNRYRLTITLIFTFLSSCTCYRSDTYRICEKYNDDWIACEKVPKYECGYISNNTICEKDPTIDGECDITCSANASLGKCTTTKNFCDPILGYERESSEKVIIECRSTDSLPRCRLDIQPEGTRTCVVDQNYAPCRSCKMITKGKCTSREPCFLGYCIRNNLG